jgi:uncharacterized membrane protein YedE/YeeE
MYRRRVIVTAAAIFALGVAFAAQPTSEHAESGVSRQQQISLWVPGTNMLMSVHESSIGVAAPPR